MMMVTTSRRGHLAVDRRGVRGKPSGRDYSWLGKDSFYNGEAERELDVKLGNFTPRAEQNRMV